MKVKNISLTTVCNKYGEWKPGEVKNIPDDEFLPGFEVIKEHFPKATKTVKKRYSKQKLQDKMERDNLEFREESEEK